eukprot:gene3711-1788_t
MRSAVATAALAVPGLAFITVPLKKRDLPDRRNMTRSVRVGVDETGAPSSIVINDYQDQLPPHTMGEVLQDAQYY